MSRTIQLLDPATIDRDLMTAILDAHDLLVKRRREHGEHNQAELILFNAIQKYGGDSTDHFEVVPKIAEEVSNG